MVDRAGNNLAKACFVRLVHDPVKDLAGLRPLFTNWWESSTTNQNLRHGVTAYKAKAATPV
jgi:hypothetical protein